uniref:hypothetical protein n=1 Tax=Acetatifactor sp. TaxID=1872090 RepID=UPI004056F5B2
MNQHNYHIRPLSCEEAVAIYRDIAPAHFPGNELKPVAAIESLYDRNAYLGLGLYETSASVTESDTAPTNASTGLLGYALFLTVPGTDAVLLDYYAILEEYRSLGLGSFFLQEMKKYFKDSSEIQGILIETEDPAFAADQADALLRNRRNAFYHKNGAFLTGVACTLFGVPFQIHFMPTVQNEFDSPGNSADLSNTASYRERMEALYRFMLPDSAYTQHVIWRS